MKDLLIAIARGLVEDPSAVTVDVDEPDEEGTTVYHLHVAERIAKAIRVVMRAAATRSSEKVSVEID